MMIVRMMRRAMEQEAGGCSEGEGEIHSCYNQGNSKTSIPHGGAPPDHDVLSHARRYTPFRETRLPTAATCCNRIVERLDACLPDRHSAAEVTNRLFSAE